MSSLFRNKGIYLLVSNLTSYLEVIAKVIVIIKVFKVEIGIT